VLNRVRRPRYNSPRDSGQYSERRDFDMEKEEKKEWIKPQILRSLTAESLREEMRGRDLTAHGGGQFRPDCGQTSCASVFVEY
jgi:hypothetical protein